MKLDALRPLTVRNNFDHSVKTFFLFFIDTCQNSGFLNVSVPDFRQFPGDVIYHQWKTYDSKF